MLSCHTWLFFPHLGRTEAPSSIVVVIVCVCVCVCVRWEVGGSVIVLSNSSSEDIGSAPGEKAALVTGFLKILMSA